MRDASARRAVRRTIRSCAYERPGIDGKGVAVFSLRLEFPSRSSLLERRGLGRGMTRRTERRNVAAIPIRGCWQHSARVSKASAQRIIGSATARSTIILLYMRSAGRADRCLRRHLRRRVRRCRAQFRGQRDSSKLTILFGTRRVLSFTRQEKHSEIKNHKKHDRYPSHVGNVGHTRRECLPSSPSVGRRPVDARCSRVAAIQPVEKSRLHHGFPTRLPNAS